MSTKAWQRHGCYMLGSQQYFNVPLGKSLIGCQDDWNSLDHFDPTSDSRRMFAHFMYLRTVYGALQDGFNLVQRGNWTYFIDRPGSNGTLTEMGLWSVSRSSIEGVQTLSGNHTDQVWMLYSNENSTQSWSYDCMSELWISSPYQSGTTVRNLLAPYEEYTLQDSGSSFYNDSKAPWYGCLNNVTMPPFGFKALVPVNEWVAPPPALTRFSPGHDARITAEAGQTNATVLDISLEFNVEMSCDSVTNSLTLNMSSSGNGTTPTIDQSSIKCAAVTGTEPIQVSGVSTSVWSWSATLQNVPDGILTIIVKNPTTNDGTASTGVSTASFITNAQLMFVNSRAQTVCWSARVLPRMSSSFQIPIMIMVVSSPAMGSTRIRIRPMVQTCSDGRGILAKTGPNGRTGRTRQQWMRTSLTTPRIFGKDNI